MTSILGVTDLASAHNGRGYFEIRSGAGQTNPAPSMAITDEHGMFSYYSRGRDLDHSSQGRYPGIGKYTAESSGASARQLAEIKHMLSKRDAAVRDAVNAGPVLSYSFDMDGHHYKGAFNYRAEEPVQNKIVVSYSLAKELLSHGKAEINLRPALSIRSDANRLLIELEFSNEGRHEVLIDGLQTWTGNLAIPSRQYVEVRGSNSAGAEFKARLESKYLTRCIAALRQRNRSQTTRSDPCRIRSSLRRVVVRQRFVHPANGSRHLRFCRSDAGQFRQAGRDVRQVLHVDGSGSVGRLDSGVA